MKSPAWILLLVAAFLVFILGARILGPSDLWDREQPRTIAYTVDMVQHGNWVLPNDAFGLPATKPPFYNWMSVPFVMGLGYAEWVHKIPAVISTVGVLVALLLYGKKLQPSVEGGTGKGVNPWMLGVIACFIWLASWDAFRLVYLARPDIPLVALLTAAWASASVMITSERTRHGHAAIFWLCTLGAAVDKGPLALFALAYLVVAALLIRRSPKVLLRTGWWWGLPVLLIGSGLWMYGAYSIAPEYISQGLLGREVGMRFDAGESLKNVLNGLTYPITGILPWSILVLGVLWAIGPKKWFAHPLAPAIIWVFLLTLGFAFTAHRRREWYAPIYPQMAIVAATVALGIIERTWHAKFPIRPAHFLGLSVAVGVGLVIYNAKFSRFAKTQWGDNAIAFVNDIRQKVGNDPVLFLDGERSGIESLMGIQQVDPPPAELLANAKWCVKYFNPEEKDGLRWPSIVSKMIYAGQPEGGDRGIILGLFPLSRGQGVAEYAAYEKIPRHYDEWEGIPSEPGTAVRKYARFFRLYPDAVMEWRSGKPVPRGPTSSSQPTP
jgi:4-amino-4-deoxy-L-arabinose transferase-like glycosyltransferase